MRMANEAGGAFPRLLGALSYRAASRYVIFDVQKVASVAIQRGRERQALR